MDDTIIMIELVYFGGVHPFIKEEKYIDCEKKKEGA